MSYKKVLCIVCAVVMYTTTSMATMHNIHIEWGYTPPSSPVVSGFRLYQEGVGVCDIMNSDATDMDCDVDLVNDTTSFTLTALFDDNSESPHSVPFPFAIGDEDPPLVMIPGDEKLKLYKIQVI